MPVKCGLRAHLKILVAQPSQLRLLQAIRPQAGRLRHRQMEFLDRIQTDWFMNEGTQDRTVAGNCRAPNTFGAVVRINNPESFRGSPAMVTKV